MPGAPCSGWACTRAWSSSTSGVGVVGAPGSASGSRRSESRPSPAGRLGCAARTGGAARSSASLAHRAPEVVRRSAARAALPWVSASTRLPERPRSCFSTTALAAAAGRDHDVAGPQRVEPAALRLRGRRGGRRRARRAARRYSSTSPAGWRRRLAPGRAGSRRPLEVAVERHDVAVGVELREREVEQVARLVAVGSAAPGSPPCCRSARNDDVSAYVRRDASPATWSNGTNGSHSTTDVADVVDAAAAGPPGELRVLPRRQQLVVLAGELRQLLDRPPSGPAC